MPELKRRAGFIDELRGLAVVTMVIYHALYDIFRVFRFFDVYVSFGYGSVMNSIAWVIAGIFIFLSGICCRYSSNNLMRGVKTFLWGYLITIITSLFMPDLLIRFGILHMLGICMILFGLWQKVFDKLPVVVGIILSVLLFLLTFQVPDGKFGIVGASFYLPDLLYQSDMLYPFGFANGSFYSSDYYPLLPWFFLFLCGTYFGRWYRYSKLPRFFYREHIVPLAWVGKHSLAIYLLHQPILFGIFYAVEEIIRLMR